MRKFFAIESLKHFGVYDSKKQAFCVIATQSRLFEQLY
jgi:L-fucose mutarotase/ribose pyranase (RbsD/FucU family)